jgi:hypothetical protein
MEIKMNKKNVLLVIFCCFCHSFVVNAHPRIVIKNETEWPIYIDTFQTNGSIVQNEISLTGSTIESKKEAVLDIVITSAACISEDNFVDLCVFNTETKNYYPVRLNWNSAFVEHNYMNKEAFRITKKTNHGASVLYTFLNADRVPQLSTDAINEWKQDQFRQQQLGIAAIKMDFGLGETDKLVLPIE